MTNFRLALDPPTGPLALLGPGDIERALTASRTSPRKRIILPFHRSPDDPLHRMLNAIQVGSYVRPHRHLSPPKSEAWIVLRGELLFVCFEDDGRVAQAVVLSPTAAHFGVDLVPGQYHTIVALEPDTVIYEVKSGPYTQTTDKAFAPWAPEEGSLEAENYLSELEKLANRRIR